MNTISQAYVNALLADATYVNLVQGMSEVDLKRDLEVRMTPTQAAYIAANFEVASSINSSDIALFGSGFDATCQRRLNIDPPCRSNIDPGRVAEF